MAVNNILLEKKSDWVFTKSQEGDPLILANTSGRTKFVEDPSAPAEDAIAALGNAPENAGIIILPPCSAETINKLAKSFPSMTRVIVVDHLGSRLADWEKLILPKVKVKTDTLLLTKKINPDSHSLMSLMDQSPLQYYLGKYKCYFPRRHRRIEADFARYLDGIIELVTQQKDIKVRFQNQESWHQALNALYILKNKRIEKHTFTQNQQQLPYVIAGAGPSLDGNIEILKKYKDNVIILACERALGTFKHHGLKPDYVLCVENIHGMIRHFNQHKEFTENIPLIAPYSVTHIVAENYNGPIIFTNNETDNAWLEPLNEFSSKCGKCVGHYGYFIAETLNASKIILIGSDLSFKDNKSHTNHTHSEALSHATLSVPGFYNDSVATSSTYKGYLDSFVDMIDKSSIPVFNCTEGGAFISGAKHQSLEKTLANMSAIPSHTLHTHISEETVSKFYTGLIQQIKKAKRQLTDSRKSLNKIDRSNPIHFFGFLKKEIQVLCNQYVNSQIMLNYHEIRTNYNSQRYDSLKKSIEELWQEMYDAVDFLLAIDSMADYDGGDPNSCLLFKTSEMDISWFSERYTHLSCIEMPALQSLPQIWELIKKHNIGKIIAFERNVIPDSWTLPGIECIDIKQSSLKPYHAVDGYSIATINDEALESWKSKYPNGIIPTTEIKFEHLDDLIRAD